MSNIKYRLEVNKKVSPPTINKNVLILITRLPGSGKQKFLQHIIKNMLLRLIVMH